jgi:hypothetical protein
MDKLVTFTCPSCSMSFTVQAINMITEDVDYPKCIKVCPNCQERIPSDLFRNTQYVIACLNKENCSKNWDISITSPKFIIDSKP